MNVTPIPTTSEVIKRYNLLARKSLGQHFLLDPNITDKIVRASHNLSNTNIIEIGAGPGGLTRSLLTSPAKAVYAVEKDERFYAPLEELQGFYPEKLFMLKGDALKISLSDHVLAPRAIIANLPYNIGTELLFNWLDEIAEHPDTYQFFTLMFQKEVAERISAEPDTKQYGKLAVMAGWLCDIEHYFDLPARAFLPPPKVDSSVVYLVPLPKPRFPAKKELLNKVVSAAFGNRRKMLRSSLKTLMPDPEKLLQKADIDPQRRAETLSIEEFCRLSEVFRLYQLSY